MTLRFHLKFDLQLSDSKCNIDFKKIHKLDINILRYISI